MRLHEHIINNKWILFVLDAEFGIQCAIIELPLLNEIFRTTHLRWSMHITVAVFALGALAVNLIAKKIFEDEDAYSPHFKINMNEDPNQQNNKVYATTSKVLEWFSKPEEKEKDVLNE